MHILKIVRNIPNILTIFRILLIPVFVWQMITGNTLVAGVILLVSGVTDVMDGILARRLGWVTNLGKVLDPIADKITLFAVCIVLLIVMRNYWIFFTILIFKETLHVVMGYIMLRRNVEFTGARWFGKIATATFYITMIIIVIWPGIFTWLAVSLLALSAVLSLIAAFLYMPTFIRSFKVRKNEL